MQITIINPKYKAINYTQTKNLVQDANRILGSKNLEYYELENGAVLITPNYHHCNNSGFTHDGFKSRIIFNSAIIYHPKNNNYTQSYAQIRWLNDETIKRQELSRLKMYAQ